MTFLHKAHFLTLLMDRWASVHISTSVLLQREKYIPSLSISLNEELEGANIKAQSPSSQPARSRSLRGTPKNIHSLWGAEAAWTRLARQSCQPGTPLLGCSIPTQHPTDTAQKKLKAAGKQHLLSPGVSLSRRLLRTLESLERGRRGAAARLCPQLPKSHPEQGRGPPFGLPYMAALAKGTERIGNSLDDFREKLLLSLPAVKTSNHKQQLNFPPSLFLICRHFIAIH